MRRENQNLSVVSPSPMGVAPIMLDRHKRHERYLESARGYLMLEMPRQAIAELKRARELFPGNPCGDWWLLQAEALRMSQNYDDALDAYRAAGEIGADELTMLMGIAWCYKRTDQLSRAIAAMRRAYRRHPDAAVVLYNLACYYSLAGEKQQALSWLARALRMQSDLARLVADETDFDLLRDDESFQQLVSLVGSAG
jgi:tetratricopeptide (TPR) repeat protein